MSTAKGFQTGVTTFRSIAQLIRQQKQGAAATVPSVKHFVELIRQNEVTDQRHCRAPEELQFIAESYRTYLTSGLKYQELFAKYHRQAERSVEESAAIVGLKLPETVENK